MRDEFVINYKAVMISQNFTKDIDDLSIVFLLYLGEP